MVIPILKHFYSIVSNLDVVSHKKQHKGVHHPTKCDIINDIKLFKDSISQDILSQSFDVIQPDVA